MNNPTRSPGLVALVALAAAASGCFYGGTYGARYGYATTTGYAQPAVLVAQPVAQPVVVAQPSAYAVPVSQGTQVQGTLDASDPRNERGALADDYVVQLNAGVPVTITTIGGQSFDGAGSLLDVYTYLYFNGVEVDHNDDGAGYPHSRIFYTPPYSGTYAIRVSSFGAGLRQGAYTLIVQ